ncbi:MAG: serine/threonine protein kinase [Desulfobacterium sp.]|nr:serine/threonine protein kinase [Desulfobacterium sp.]
MENKIDQYQVVSKIDSGGMATVYKGIQPSLNRTVAIKVLHQQFSEDPQFVKRFTRESLIIARLTHPNIIHVIDRGIMENGMPYFVMDFVEGTDVAKIIKQAGHTVNQKLEIMVQVCKALSYAHKNGVIHRDIKPANILIDLEGNALVADFGIAHLFHENVPDNLQMTSENLIMGTLAYMSPEQKTGDRQITHSSDLYSLGVVMFELFTGLKPLGQFKKPFDLNPNLPQGLDSIILHCLQPEISDRPASADSIRETLLGILQGAHIQASKRKKATQGVQKMEDIFTLLDIIKETKYGTVYLFRHKENLKLMVVKRYNLPMGGLKSANLLKDLKHPNIVEILGVSGHQSNYIIVMEYVGGGSLADRMLVPHACQDALKIIEGVCQGLAFAHNNQIVHGNLRPTNILFTDSGKVKITDFGLNEHYALDPDKANWFNTCSQPSSMQADIFAVGAILYKLLVGHIPVLKGKSFVPHPAFSGIPSDVQQLVIRLLSQDQATRFQSADQVVAEIHKIQTAFETELDETVMFDSSSMLTNMETSANDIETKISRNKNWRILFLLTLLVVTALIYFFVACPEAF